MSHLLQEKILGLIPKTKLQELFSNNRPDEIEDMVYDIAGLAPMEEEHENASLPEILFTICRVMIRYLIGNNEKEKVFEMFKRIAENIEYVEAEPIPDNLFEF